MFTPGRALRDDLLAAPAANVTSNVTIRTIKNCIKQLSPVIGNISAHDIYHSSDRSIINTNNQYSPHMTSADNYPLNATNITTKNNNNELSPLIGNTSVNDITPASDKSIINKNVQYLSQTSSVDNHQLSNDKSLKEFTEVMLRDFWESEMVAKVGQVNIKDVYNSYKFWC